MATLIDGYNLLYAVGIPGYKIGSRALERARSALVNFLAATLSDLDRETTTIIFDAKDPPPGRPREFEYRGIRVRYAVGYSSADQLVEELIRADSAPRRLVVVSSDHWIQQAAKRRRATAVDSEQWYDNLSRRPRENDLAEHRSDEKPVFPKTEAEIDHWLDVFASEPQPTAEPDSVGDELPGQAEQDRGIIDPDFINPFPPGYAEDLFSEEQEFDD